MTYSSDIDALNPDHRYHFDGNTTDAIGTADASAFGGSSGSPICEGVATCYEFTAASNKITLPSGVSTNAETDRLAIAGWFSKDSTQFVTYRIWGDTSSAPASWSGFSILAGWGGIVVFDAFRQASFSLQTYSNFLLANDRPYHFAFFFESNTYGNSIRAYIDGVRMTETLGEVPGASLFARTDAGAGNYYPFLLGGEAIETITPIQGSYNQWALWVGADSVLTDTQIRETLFEKGALPDVTITDQAGLDALADTVRPNAPLCIRVDVAGSLSLTADNVVFDPLASIHVQYTGTGTLTWTNTNGSNASIGSTTGGGTIVIQEAIPITVRVKASDDLSNIEGARVYIYAAAGGPLTVGDVISTGLTDANGVYSDSLLYTTDQPYEIRARKSSAAPYYKTGLSSGTLTGVATDKTILLVGD